MLSIIKRKGCQLDQVGKPIYFVKATRSIIELSDNGIYFAIFLNYANNTM